MGDLMKVTSYFDDKGKTFQEIIEQFLLLYYNENLEKVDLQ